MQILHNRLITYEPRCAAVAEWLERITIRPWSWPRTCGAPPSLSRPLLVLLLATGCPITSKVKVRIKTNNERTAATWNKGLLALSKDSSAFVGDLLAPQPSLTIRAGPRGLSLAGHSGSAVKGVLVSWERELRPSPDAEALRRDSVLRPGLEEVQCESRQSWAWITVSCLHCCRMGD